MHEHEESSLLACSLCGNATCSLCCSNLLMTDGTYSFLCPECTALEERIRVLNEIVANRPPIGFGPYIWWTVPNDA